MKRKLSTRDIWKHLKDRLPIEDLLNETPIEYHEWIYEKSHMIQEMYGITQAQCYINYFNNIEPVDKLTRKEVAEKILTQKKGNRKIFFYIYDGKDISELIWKKIYPSYEIITTEDLERIEKKLKQKRLLQDLMRMEEDDENN
jgi:hypothetical protein